MKNILFLFIGCMILGSCYYSNDTEPVNSDGISRALFAKKFTYDGHVYIEFKDGGLYGHGFTHDPKCLMKDIDSIVNKKNRSDYEY